MVGPVYVNSAEPGDVLEVRILDVRLAYSYGYNTQCPYQGTLPEEFPRF
jgi:acetamidase/formamidase